MSEPPLAELGLLAENRRLRERIAGLERENHSAANEAEEQNRKLLAALQEEKERLLAVLASMTDEIWFADADKHLVLVNPAVLREFHLEEGGRPEVAKVAASFEVLRPDGTPRPVEEAPPLRALAGEVVSQEEEIVRMPGTGELRHREVNAAPVKDASGTIVGSVCVVRDITKRKRTEEQVIRGQKTFSELVERAPFGIYIVDSGFRIAHMNAGSQNGAFRNVRPVIGREFSEAMRILWPEPVAAEIIAFFRHTLETGEPYYSPPFVNPRHDVETVESYEWELHRMTLPDGQFGVICYYFDSTKLRQAEAALRESEERLRLAQTAAKVGIWDWNLRSGQLRWTRELEEIYGLEPGSVSAYEDFRRSVHPEDLEMAEANWKEAVAQHRGFEVEFRILQPGGRIVWVHNRGAATYDEAGAAIRVFGVNIDITGRKRAEDKLFETNQRLQALMQALPVGVSFSDDRTCQRITGNPAVLAQFEVGSQDNLSASAPDPAAPGRQVRFFQAGREIGAAELPLQRAVGSGAVIPPMEVEVRLPGGRIWFAEVCGAPVRDRQGNVVGGVAVTVDITERKRSEERLRHAQKLESLGLLAGGVAHDFNNLLVGVIGNASLAQEMLPSDNPAVELLEGVVRSGEQAAHLTRQMLAYSGRGKFLIEKLNLSKLLPEISGLVRTSIQKLIVLRFELDENLPLIEADRGQVQQVFMNLVLNAAEAIGGSPGKISVRTGVQGVIDRFPGAHAATPELPAGEYVFLEVTDDGCGMDEETISRIFDPFFSTKFSGRGLGLAAVAGIVRGHKGAITVDSAPGKGSCFRVLFPALVGVPADHRPPQAQGALRGSGVVLVVDDESVVREMAGKVLEHHGYTVLLAEGGLQAIDIVRRYPGDIAAVILDLSMPGMGGVEVLHELRRIRPTLKVLVSSGFSEAETMALFEGQYAAGFVQKPYSAQAIAEKLAVCLS